MSDESAAGNPASGIPEEAVKAAGSIIYADIHALLDAGADRIECNPIARRVLEAALPHLLAAGGSAHRAEQDAVHADLSQLLRVLGMGDHARPQSSHEVMLDAINEVGRLRTRLAEIENAVTWNTSCTSCATVLDSAYRETCRREAAEAALARVRALDSAAILIGGERYVRADYVREALEGDSDE